MFKRENNVFWKWFNFSILFFSAGFLVGTYLIIDSEPVDCGNLIMSLYVVLALHTANMLVSFLNLCNLEGKVCT